MPAGSYKKLLGSFGFQAFLASQFLWTFNDNVYRITVALLAAEAAVGPERGGTAYLSLVGVIFILPFLLFSGYAGHVTDIFNKRTLLIAGKCLEVVFMGLGLGALISGRMDFMLLVLFLMALLLTFFTPAKYGILPEMLPERDLSRANGLLDLSTFLAIILGTSVGTFLFSQWEDRLGLLGFVLLLVAAVGVLVSLGISQVPHSGARKPLQADPWHEIRLGLVRILGHSALWPTVLGIAYFWFMGALLQLDLLLFGKAVMGLDDFRIGILMACLATGIGAGSVTAGRLSGDKIELGLVPLGAVGTALFALLLAAAPPSYAGAAAALFGLGFFGGLFIIPLKALLQQRSGRQERGRLIATANFLSTLGILLASFILWVLRDLFLFRADDIIWIAGLLTLAATVYILALLPDFLIRFVFWMLTHTIYNIRIVGQEHIPFRGPALLVANHMSHMDGLLIGACVQRFIRFLVYRPYYDLRSLNWLFRLMKAVPVPEDPEAGAEEAVHQARKALQEGHVVCIFAEGAISRTGNLQPFKKNFEKIARGLRAPIIPVYLDQLWGSIFSFKEGRFFWKWPERLPYPVTVSFGRPLPAAATTRQVRQAVMELGSEAAEHRRGPGDLLHLRFIRTARRHWSSLALADSTGMKLSYGRALIGSLTLARWIRKRFAGEDILGVLLPSTVMGALVNIAVLMAGKVPVNLNFTAGREAMDASLARCGIRTLLTSRKFLVKAQLEPQPGMAFLEKAPREITRLQKAAAAITAFLLPVRLLQALWGGGKTDPDDLATVIFSSGSTGVPKGVMLSHHNILSNIEGLAQIFWITPRDRVMGVLPFFHAFGFTGTLWFPLVTGLAAVYHHDPTDARTVGEMTSKYRASILIGTPTFYGLYLRKCGTEDFLSLRYAIAGAEKLREPLARAFRRKFGLDLLEGYGCTEMGPVVSVNIPDVRHGEHRQVGQKTGSVGHPIPGVSVSVVDPETGRPLTGDKAGLLLVKGPNRMVGYLGQPEQTREVFRNGWYVTGDIAFVDEEGFIHITDRLARFSKIGGEMVPHLRVEEAVGEVLGHHDCVVTAVPDERRGERLVVLYVSTDVAPEALWEELSRSDLPRLWIPKRDDIFPVDAIPTLASGKVDLKKVRETALALVRPPDAARPGGLDPGRDPGV